MQTTGLARRLWEAFFPPEPSKKLTMFRSYPGTEEEFFDYLNRHGYEARVPLDENNPKPTVYVDPETGEVFAMCVRWPNRNFYYLLSQV
ncbi:hypothetical protein pEaSNUABM29_00061 [Erwinia phage pEa_SNUABM_29]|nr:hypothetical protein pEaSNUABM29_00061 [Erwinia phage pEa_SNUABM_29]